MDSGLASTRAYHKIGECSIIDPSRNALVAGGNVAKFAAQYHVIADWECVEEESKS